ncbi:hypothetical protein NS226_09030 [Aureimonas ureilytica]|uniref:DUF4391 domain-containing protein n=1 Tax=Aureimonas ureilytica TaxID=401562 RepID=A0A175R9C9_9HYPH|nr:DUF4391 domain-containing protein [Aureimonas ureilytica]KTQ96009.1 hypothetical protein NS226_09030 [Aureimonas ureilytica]
MTVDANMRAVVDALGLPLGARVDARVPKKLLVEEGAPTLADKRAIQDGIDELQWFAACKPATIGVPSFADDMREYLEIAVVGCVFRPDAKGKPAKAVRLIELIHRAIPYPVLLVTADESGLALSAAHKRRAQNDAGRVVVDRVVATTSLRLGPGDEAEAGYLQSLALARQPRSDLCVLYASWLAWIEALNAARLTGVFTGIKDNRAIEERREALEEHKRLSQESSRLRALIARTKQIRQKVDLSNQLRLVNEKLLRQEHILRGGT